MYTIENYKFGEMIINGIFYHRDLIILTDKILQNWRRKEGHRLILDDIGDIPLSQIECLIIGTGKFGMMKVDETVISALNNAGIECIVYKTDKSVEIFNCIIHQEKVAAAFHLTC
ncbi:MAG: Mth938-like domain-containing protein [Candidatus Marinimicrobia bacterium]|nr:Mth938-like domain-containing protein [Candidatus Neomarinimicrobiota bacterium]